MPSSFRHTAGIILLSAGFLTSCQAAVPQPTPTPVPPTAVPAPTAAPTATPAHPGVKADASRFDFSNRTMFAGPGSLLPGENLQAVFSVAAGQKVTIQFTAESGSGGALSLWGADGSVIVPETVGVTAWEGVLPTAQDYFVNIRNTGPQEMNYQFIIKLPPMVPPQATRIQFQPNTTGWYTPGEVEPHSRLTFVLTAMAGQQMNVDLITTVQDGAFLKIWSADGTNYTPMSPTQNWVSILPATQDYYIEVYSVSDQPIPYQLSVNIPAIDSAPVAVEVNPPITPKTMYGARIAVDQIIRFDAGPMMLDINGAVINGERDRYRLNALAGETLDVIVTSAEGNAVFTIFGPDNMPLPGTEEGRDINNWAVPISVEGTYSIVVGSTRGNATYKLSVSI